jgi:hypothetical protein
MPSDRCTVLRDELLKEVANHRNPDVRENEVIQRLFSDRKAKEHLLRLDAKGVNLSPCADPPGMSNMLYVIGLITKFAMGWGGEPAIEELQLKKKEHERPAKQLREAMMTVENQKSLPPNAISFIRCCAEGLEIEAECIGIVRSKLQRENFYAWTIVKHIRKTTGKCFYKKVASLLSIASSPKIVTAKRIDGICTRANAMERRALRRIYEDRDRVSPRIQLARYLREGISHRSH